MTRRRLGAAAIVGLALTAALAVFDGAFVGACGSSSGHWARLGSGLPMEPEAMTGTAEPTAIEARTRVTAAGASA